MDIEDLALYANAMSITALNVAYFSEFPYREPGLSSIQTVDESLGDAGDVPDPLLSTHRYIRFYLISAGETVYSSAKLLRESGNVPVVALPALARVTAEHCSRALFLSDPDLGYERRIARAAALTREGILSAGKGSEGAKRIVEMWTDYHDRHRIQTRRKDKLPSYSELVSRYFDGYIYESLSQPVHGNAAWVALSVLCEQQGAPLPAAESCWGLAFATACITATTEGVAELWDIDLDSHVGGDSGDLKWSDLRELVDQMFEQAHDERERLRTSRLLVDNPDPYRLEVPAEQPAGLDSYGVENV
ncbi:hypothetical protein QSJ18_10555 [Gordonia sp. ABSL1-1]|uniref:hypothetical protein n=1 Tax=Gordonia sp. ABSL1-1 TaxID=3053923 RepID=UPI0025741C95|nr:hypothetical protein [Gordonia sp. ABSL1-1]MDL9937184.1 hypothetical protein [Gordonia sp. ABSL1-1]